MPGRGTSTRPPAPAAGANPSSKKRPSHGLRKGAGAAQGLLHRRIALAFAAAEHQFATQVGRAHGLRLVDLLLLHHVESSPDVSARQLSRALWQTPSNVGRWLERLEDRGLIKRAQNGDDGRAHAWRLSPRGSRLLDRLITTLAEIEQAWTLGLDRQARVAVAGVLDRVEALGARDFRSLE